MTEAAEPETDWGCYRHPYEAAGVKCTRCDRPICPKCMITAPVGFQCPECVKGAAPVRRYSEICSGAAAQAVVVTSAIVAINAAVFVLGIGRGGDLMNGSPRMTLDYALNGFLVANGDWYRLVTAGFLHYGIIHIGFNMLILYRLGQLLEPAFGKVRYALLYIAALLGGSVGALLLTPDAYTAGASGAVFGLMGAAAVAMQRRGINIMQSSIGGLLVMNLLLTFVINNVSIGGHIGGLVAGGAGAFVLLQTEDKPQIGTAAVAALAAVLFGVGLAIA